MKRCIERCRFGSQLRPSHGFTLAETILVMGMLAIAAAVLMRMQPRIFSAQTALRDEEVGIEIQRACAERLLAVRRQNGYSSVTPSTCNAAGTFTGFGGIGGFQLNPLVTLSTSAAASAPACADDYCTVSITVSKTSGAAAPLPALIVRFTPY